MATSFFGRIEPEGRRLGSDLSLVGKWVESYPQRISSSAVPVARLSPADQETLFSKTKCEFRIFEQSDKSVKLEAVPPSNVLQPPNWDDFRKVADPEVVAMMSHPNYSELVRKHEQLDKLVNDCEPEAGQIYSNAYKYALNAGCDIKTADAYAQQAANDFVDTAGIALQRMWREEKRARLLGNATSEAGRQSGQRARSKKTADEIKAVMIQAIKESNRKHNPATPASRKKDLKINPRATAPIKDHQCPTPTTSPAHGSDTSARSARSFLSESPPSSSSSPSPTLLPKPAITILKRPQTTSETKATASPTPLASVHTPNPAVPLDTMGHTAGYVYVASSGPFMGTQPMYSPGTLVPIASPCPVIYAGNVPYGPYSNGHAMPNYAYTWVPSAAPIAAADLKENHVDSSKTTAKHPKVSGKTAADTLLQRTENQYQVYKSQLRSSIMSDEVEHPLPGAAEIGPAYWATKERKARFLHEKLSSLRTIDMQVQREYMSGTHAPLSNTVHIFVDLSNIVIGFYDTLKMNRGLPLEDRVKAPPFSFKNFDTILTRGRKVEKRVVAGSVRKHSHKRPEYMADAAELDYEMCILTRVPKPDTKPKPDSKSKKHGRRSEVSSDQFQSRGEQCVDEVLHLKILQSALDVPHPGTMVLATGDAACAEYSDGFRKNAERALAKGWKIELYAWKSNIARDWRDPEFTSKWGSRFRIIELDEFCEELLDLTVESVGGKAQ